MSTILTRIAKIAEEEGLTITALEKRIGASKSVLSRALANNSDIQSKWIQNVIFAFPKYSATWLLTGEGEMINNTEIQRKLLQKAMSEPMDLDFFGLNKKKLTALIKVGDKYYSANTLDELKDIITQIEKN